MNNKTGSILLRRFFTSILVLFLLVTFIFILIRIAPGDPVQKFISPGFSPSLSESVRESFDLDKSIFNQYISFVSGFIKGDLGVSYDYRQPVLKVIWGSLSFTAAFIIISFIIQLVISFMLAYASVKLKNTPGDKLLSGLLLVAYATPVFVTGVFLIYIFSVQLGLFPSSGLQPAGVEYASGFQRLTAMLHHLFLPFLTLTVVEVSIFYKYLRDNLNEIYNKTFVLNLRANGYNERTILFRHVMPNAINPLVSVAGIELGVMLGGTLIVEVIFGLPGMGRLTMDAIATRDYPLITGCVLVAGTLMNLSNLFADLIRAGIDKRTVAGALN